MSTGSILNATESQFVALFPQLDYLSGTEKAFVEENNAKKEVAQKDAKELEKLSVTPTQVAQKLNEVIEKAKQSFAIMKKNNQIDYLSPDFKMPEVDVDDKFRVSGFDLCEMRLDVCTLCKHKISGPVTYQIENLKTHEKLNVMS